MRFAPQKLSLKQRIKLVVILLVTTTIFRIFPKFSFAEEKSVFIDTVSPNQNILTGQTFSVNVAIGSDYANTSFYYLFYGGPNDELSYVKTKVKNGSLVAIYDSINWELAPTITTDESGNAYLQANDAHIDEDKPSGTYTLYVSLFHQDNPVVNINLTDSRQIFVNSIYNPTPQPTVVQFPGTIINTPTPKPTNIRIQTPNQVTGSIISTTPTPTINMKIFGTRSSSPVTSSDNLTLIPTITAIENTIVEAGSNNIKKTSNKLSKKPNYIVFFAISSAVFFAILLTLLKLIKK